LVGDARENGLARAFVELAGSLVGEFDVVDLLHRLVEIVTDLFGADAAGLLLSDPHGELQLVASSTEATLLFELFQLQSDEGPGLECFRTGTPVSVPDIAAAADRWPRFAPVAIERGYGSIHALPMRLRAQVIGALNLFSVNVGTLPEPDLKAAQALADFATIVILQERATDHRYIVLQQTQAVLHGRVVVEQAKGMLAASGVGMDQAFELMRRFAQARETRLLDVALDLAAGRIEPATVIGIVVHPSDGFGLTAPAAADVGESIWTSSIIAPPGVHTETTGAE
jgi:transcriptional regulator with GAF, ATPase, and Fis domain